jgi:hypothetical protein
VVTSIGGLNERWGQIAALAPQKAAAPGRDGGPAFDNGGSAATTDLPPISPIAGNTASALSNNTNLLLTMFSGGTRSSTSPAPEQDPTSAAEQLQPDAQLSLLVPTVSAGADGITGSTLVQELQALVSGGGSSASTRGGAPIPSAAGPPGGADAIGNSGTAVPARHNGWDNTIGPGDRGRQQVALAAYASADFSGQDSATASVLQGLSA